MSHVTPPGPTPHEPAADSDPILDLVLGQLPGDAADLLQTRIAREPELAARWIATEGLLARFRALPLPQSGVAAVRVRAHVLRFARLRHQPRVSWRRRSFEAALLVTILVLGTLLSMKGLVRNDVVPRTVVDVVARAASMLATDQAPTELSARTRHGEAPALPELATEPAVAPRESWSQLLERTPTRRRGPQIYDWTDAEVFASLVAADNDLALLRLEFRQRYSPQSRRETIALSGGSQDLEDRIQDLATQVAERLAALVPGGGVSGNGSPTELSIGLRSLLASGSTARIGPHHEVVKAIGDELVARIPSFEGADLAVALAALSDLAVVASGPLEELVAAQSQRLALDIVGAKPSRPSPLLQWRTPAPALAEAGRVLSLAPAFGLHPTLAHRARMLVFAHLNDRLEPRTYERPDVLAALVYGFGELVDRDDIDRRLVMWRPRQIARESLAAVHHLAWSIYPPRPALAEWQQELRALGTLRTPAATTDAASLLLCLTTSYAAPGVAQLLALAGR